MLTALRPLALVAVLGSSAAAEPQFVTLERASAESKIGLQTSLQLYPDIDDVYGLRAELFGQFAGQMRGGGGALGGYAHVAVGFIFGKGDSDSGVSNVELGGFYVAPFGPRSDGTFHLGLSVPTASDNLVSLLTG